MIIGYSRNFNRSFFKRIKSNSSLVKRVRERISIFIANPNDEVLKNHRLTGDKRGLYSFSINGDCRIIYQKVDTNTVEFIDIGTHNQVYGK